MAQNVQPQNPNPGNLNQNRQKAIFKRVCQAVETMLKEEQPFQTYQQNPQQFAATYSQDVLNTFVNPLPQQEASAIEQTITNIVSTINGIQTRPLALEERKLGHYSAQDRVTVSSSIATELGNLAGQFAYPNSQTEAQDFASKLDKHLKTKQETHDPKITSGMAGVDLSRVHGNNLQAELAEYERVTGHRFNPDFIKPMRKARRNLGDAVQNFWELLVWTDAMENGDQDIRNFDAGSYLYDRADYEDKFKTTLEGLYRRQIDSLDVHFGRSDSAQRIADQTGLTLDAAKYVKQKYTELKQSTNNECHLCLDSNGEEIYRPTAAGVLLSDQQWTNEFFRNHLSSRKLSQAQNSSLEQLYRTVLREKAQDHLKQYFANLDDFRQLTQHQKDYLQRSVDRNTVGDTGGSERLYNALATFEEYDRAVDDLLNAL